MPSSRSSSRRDGDPNDPGDRQPAHARGPRHEAPGTPREVMVVDEYASSLTSDGDNNGVADNGGDLVPFQPWSSASGAGGARGDDLRDDLPISEALRAAARAAAEEARKAARDRRYQVEWVDINLLVPADYNPRIMPDEEMANLEQSVETFGMLQPIIVNCFPRREGVIVGGHQRLGAAINKRWSRVPVVWTYLTLAEERAANLALNRISGLWDEHKLAAIIHEMNSEGQGEMLDLTGFSEEEIEELLSTYSQDQVEDMLDQGEDKADDVPPLEEVPTRSCPGDIWRLGAHYLLVGDSRSSDDVTRLFAADNDAGEKATCMWTDPPYGVEYVGKTKEKLTIQNDGAFDLDDLLASAFTHADAVALAPGAAVYVCEPAGAQSVTFRVRFMAAGWRFHETLVWVKDSMVLGHSDYHVKHETIIFGYKPAPKGSGRSGRGGSGWYGDDAQVTTFEIPRPKASREHPTMKPLALPSAHIANSCAPGGLVYEPFCGSGTTLLACERLGRRCRAIELAPRYADVTLLRWEKESGKEAELVSRRAAYQGYAEYAGTARTKPGTKPGTPGQTNGLRAGAIIFDEYAGDGEIDWPELPPAPSVPAEW